MRLAGSASATRTGHARTRRRAFLSARRGGEGGKFLGQFRGTALGAGRPLPIAAAHEDFVVRAALLTMKFVNRHGENM
jgi:hypothetical protein